MSAPITLSLTASARAGRFDLTCGPVSYQIEFRPSMDAVLGELLRRLPPILIGRNDPTGKLRPDELLHAVGTRLWQALMPDATPGDQRATLAGLLRNGTGSVLLALPTVLTTLPWELLCDPQAPDDTGFIARRRPLVRLLPGTTELAPIPPPLKVLLLISSPPGIEEHRRLDVESERAAVEVATRPLREDGRLHLLIEDTVTPQRVQQALLRFRPHILHYIGHGGYAEGVGGFLEWEDERGKPLLHPDAKIADLLRPRGLRAVLLHGCDTAAADTRTDFTGIAGALLGAGIPAVLAQQAKFTYESSQRASQAFYEALTSGLGLAETLFETRLALHQAGRADWAVPMLQASATGLAPLLDPGAPAAAPDPVLAQQVVAGNLPAPTRDQVFVGRQRELRALRQMLESAPGSGPVLALIAGPGGIGKSTLAARAIVRYGGRYKAVLTLSCRAYDGIDLFLKQIGEFLALQGAPEFLAAVLPEPQLSLEAKIREAVKALNLAGPLLLVIDNLESVQSEDRRIADPGLLLLLQALLFDLRAGRVLVTGRYLVEGLLPDDKFQANLLRLNLDDLSDYEIRQLVARHETLAGLSDVVVDELVAEFGGLPIVYDILSSDAASQDLEAIIFDIQRRKTDERKQRSAEEWERVRRRVVEFAALEATVSRLPEPARDLLGRLAVFRRPFPLEAIEQGLGAGREDWQPLIAWALLRYDARAGDYRLHSLTADYASGLLVGERRAATQAQVAQWYLDHANQSNNLADLLEAHALFSLAGEALRAGELANDLADPLSRFGLYQVWGDLCRTTMRTCAGSLAAEAQRQLGMIAQDQCQYEQARKLYTDALTSFEHLSDQRGRANTLGQLGNIAYVQGQYEEARRLYAEVQTSFERLGDLGGRANALGQLGNIAYVQGQYEEARRLYAEAQTSFERLGDQSGRASTLHQLGNIAYAQGQHEQARRLYAEAQTSFERLGDQRGRATTLHQLGMIAQDQGQYEQARRLYAESLSIKERLGNHGGRATTLHQLGMIAQHQGQYEEARQMYAESLSIKERLGDQSGSAHTLGQLGNIAYDQGQYEQARQIYTEAQTSFERLGDQRGRAITLHQLGNIVYVQGQYEGARRLYAEALTIFERLCDQRGRASTLHQLGMIAQDQGQYEEARQMYAESLSIKEHLGDQRGRAATLGQLGSIAREKRDFRSALCYMLEAYVIFEELRSPYREMVQDTIAEIRAEVGEAAFQELWQELAGPQPAPLPAAGNPQEALLQRLIALIQAQTWDESQRMVASQPELLSNKADTLLEQLAAAQQDQGVRQTIEQHRALLERCREVGIEAAFAELPAPQPQPGENDEPEDGMQRLLQQVYALLVNGTALQRRSFADQIAELGAQLPDDQTALAAFLSCLVAALRGEDVEAGTLEEPFAGMWRGLQEAVANADASSEEG